MKRKKKKRAFGKSISGIIAILLVMVMLVGILPFDTEVLAAESISDLDTTTKYTESLGDNASTEYAGRIWTDKTVYDTNATITAYGDTSYTIENDSDFLVAFSALATSQSISGQTQAPVDVVFIIDLSGSMSNQNSNMTINGVTKSRIAFTVDAVNSAINTLMNNPNARVGVVGYNETAVELLPLDRYTQVDATTPYFSLNRTTASNDNARLSVRAVNSSGTTISKVDSWNSNNAISVSGGTNIQGGLYNGMKLLTDVTSTTATIDGKEVTRVPSVILLSDGAPTYAMSATKGQGGWGSQSTSRNWWEPENTYGLGNGSSAYAGNGMLAMMIGAYMKNQIDAHYGLSAAEQKTTLYSVGMGLDNLDNDQKNLARATLNPKQYLDTATSEYSGNSYAQTILGYWNQYCGTSGNDNTPTIQCERNESYELTHPTTGDISGDALKNYVDHYYAANEVDSVTDVFANIVNNILISSPEIPTEHDAENPVTSGYITYTDPLGEYMEVKDFEAIIYGGKKYVNQAEPVTNGNVTTYKFTDIAEGNAVYKEQSLENIIIEVKTTTDADGVKSQTLTIKIPAALIPIRVNTITLNSDKSVKTHTNNGAYPIRIFYTVGLQDAVKSGDIVSLEKISADYIEQNSNADGTINFYSNLYTGSNKSVNGDTAGDATAEFEAASTNPFYYMQKDTILYDKLTEKPATELVA
ncbi:MAG: VWA domain-containing protein [Roseburia sp.]|nr:VWA domain-containing protein [Roseburia sp.]